MQGVKIQIAFGHLKHTYSIRPITNRLVKTPVLGLFLRLLKVWNEHQKIYIFIQQLVLNLFSGDSSVTLSACYIVTPVGAINEGIIDSFTLKKTQIHLETKQKAVLWVNIESFTCLIYS